MNEKYYAGIGSRMTPEDVLKEMKEYGRIMADGGYILRSGGADGADTAFEEGCDLVNGKKEIYIPWKNFNKNKSELFNVCEEALKLAESIHPAWDQCTYGAKKLHARNCYQILGKTLDKPVECVICWTDSGMVKGGTRTAVVLAQKYHVPVFNLFNEKDRESFHACMKLLKLISS